MPMYDYQCPSCGPFEASRRLAEYKQPHDCPVCHTSSPRMMSAPQLNTMSASSRKAHITNEKSAHAPKVNRSCCSSGKCSHHSKTTPKNTVLKEGAPLPLKAQTGVRRPWQISH